MKCPECGNEMQEGSVYCTNCGWEYRMVPEFEPEIESQIDKTLSGLADKIGRGEESGDRGGAPAVRRPKRSRQTVRTKQRKGQSLRFPVRAFLAALTALVLLLIFAVLHKTTGDYIRLAKKSYAAGEYERAADYLRNALERSPRNVEARFLLFDALAETGDGAGALAALDDIVNSAVYEDADVRRAFTEQAMLLRTEGEFETLRTLLSRCPYEDVRASFAEVFPGSPEVSPQGGRVTEGDTVVLSAQAASILYTINGESPGENALRYEAPIVLEESGTCTLTAVAVSAEGARSEPVSVTYEVEKKPVPPPDILEDSGVYTEDTRIVALADKSLTIYYTVGEDGEAAKDPTKNTRETATEYRLPIEMPAGESEFRFVAMDEDGRLSEVVTRSYRLEKEHAVSVEEAVLHVKRALIAASHMQDESGRVSGMQGVLEYTADGTVEIGSDGEFYYIREHHRFDDGRLEDTGRLYAVHTESGLTRRLGYDSRGQVMLMQF